VKLAVVAGLLIAVAPAIAHAQRGDTVEYRVEEGDTCASIARRFYGSSRAYDRIHRLNPGLGPPPHRLVPGTVLVLPRPEAGGPDARLTAARGDVRARPPGGEFAPSPAGTELRRGHQVETGAASSAEITFRDTSVLAVRERTLVVVYGATERLSDTTRTATLERGTLRSRLAELSGRARVTMPDATATLDRSDAVVSVDDEGTSRLANLSGAATLSAAGADVRLPSGTGSIARRGERPAPPRPLPPAPAWAEDQPPRFVGLTGHGGTLTARWQSVEGAARYRLEVARRRDGGDVAAAIEVDAADADVISVELHRIPPAVYYLSVATIDTALFEGRPSAPREVQVLDARIIPPGGGEPVVEPYDPGDPSAPRRLPRVLPGTWIVAPVGYTCGAAGEEPRGMTTLRARGRVQVHCFDPGGREVPGFDVGVQPPEVVLASPPRVERFVRSDVQFEIRSRLPIPERVVAFPLSRDVEVGTLAREPNGALRVSVLVGADAPSEVTIGIGVAEGNERVLFGDLYLAVGRGAFDDPNVEPEPPEPPVHATNLVPSPHALALAAQPTVAPLVGYAPPGLDVHAAMSAIGDGSGADPTLRVAMGVRALLPRAPLGARFDWVIDPAGEHLAPAQLGNADVRAGVFGVAPFAERASAAIEIAAWIPTNATDASIGVTRLVPSGEISFSPLDPLFLRTRQAAIAELASEASALWASAYGADLSFLDGLLGVGLELDLALGREAGSDVAAVSLGGSVALHLGPFELALAARAALSDDARAMFGAYTTTLALRARVPTAALDERRLDRSIRDSTPARHVLGQPRLAPR
jgi:hypothetical protein